MSKPDSYTEKQIEISNLLHSVSKEDGITNEIEDEIMRMVEDVGSTSFSVQKGESEDSIRIKLLDEKDWRKRAALAAMLISKSLE